MYTDVAHERAVIILLIVKIAVQELFPSFEEGQLRVVNN